MFWLLGRVAFVFFAITSRDLLATIRLWSLLGTSHLLASSCLSCANRDCSDCRGVKRRTKRRTKGNRNVTDEEVTGERVVDEWRGIECAVEKRALRAVPETARFSAATWSDMTARHYKASRGNWLCGLCVLVMVSRRWIYPPTDRCALKAFADPCRVLLFLARIWGRRVFTGDFPGSAFPLFSKCSCTNWSLCRRICRSLLRRRCRGASSGWAQPLSPLLRVK